MRRSRSSERPRSSASKKARTKAPASLLSVVLRSDFFISYTKSDREKVRRWVDFLVEAGLSCEWDRRFTPGKHFPREIAQKIRESRAFCVFISGKAIQSKWVEREVDCALGLSKPILAIDLEEIDASVHGEGALELLGTRNRLRVTDPDFEARLNRWIEEQFAEVSSANRLLTKNAVAP